jgi:hypothetical protein
MRLMQHELMKARTTDLYHQAERERMAKAMSRARRTQRQRRTRSLSGHTAIVLARRALAVLGARSPSPTR